MHEHACTQVINNPALHAAHRVVTLFFVVSLCWRSMVAIAAFISIIASLNPIQLRGPCPKGMK